MKLIYRLLLRLYPRDVRDRFGAEMLGVVNASTDEFTGIGHAVREAAGLLHSAAAEHARRLRVPPVAVALLLAAIVQGLFYRVVLRLLHYTAPAQDRFDENSQLALGLMAVAVLLVIIPLTVLLTKGIRHQAPRQRSR